MEHWHRWSSEDSSVGLLPHLRNRQWQLASSPSGAGRRAVPPWVARLASAASREMRAHTPGAERWEHQFRWLTDVHISAIKCQYSISFLKIPNFFSFLLTDLWLYFLISIQVDRLKQAWENIRDPKELLLHSRESVTYCPVSIEVCALQFSVLLVKGYFSEAETSELNRFSSVKE